MKYLLIFIAVYMILGSTAEARQTVCNLEKGTGICQTFGDMNTGTNFIYIDDESSRYQPLENNNYQHKGY